MLPHGEERATWRASRTMKELVAILRDAVASTAPQDEGRSIPKGQVEAPSGASPSLKLRPRMAAPLHVTSPCPGDGSAHSVLHRFSTSIRFYRFWPILFRSRPNRRENVVRRSSNGNLFAGGILRWMSRKPYESGMFLQ